jgi:hypothetical protein
MSCDRIDNWRSKDVGSFLDIVCRNGPIGPSYSMQWRISQPICPHPRDIFLIGKLECGLVVEGHA